MSTALPSLNVLIADPQYRSLKEHVVGSTGLSYYQDKDADFAGRVGRRLSSLGMQDCAAYLDILRDPLRGPPEIDELVTEITIGETYFFRHRDHFDALRDVVLPELIAHNQANRCLRIWCAGCADGAEPYSLAILLKRDMARQLAGWDVSILATDINRRCLARAGEGRFEEWAFRSTPEDLRRDCFSFEDGLWSIAPQYREGVSFQYHNLAEHPFPSLVNNLAAFDLISCRNVMIYFGPDLMRKMTGQFYDCLVPGGWLLVGPSEPNMTFFTAFRAVNAPGVTLYQKPDQSDPDVAGAPAPDRVTPASTERAGTIVAATLADVRRHADRGAWAEALRDCGQLLKQDNLNSAIHFYHALVLEQMRRHAEAERALRRAIYLDRQSVLPHYYLGLFLQSRGDWRPAARSFENALDLLRLRNDSEVFADGDGITVAELKKLAVTHLEILRERV